MVVFVVKKLTEEKATDFFEESDPIACGALVDFQILLDASEEGLDLGSLKPMPSEGFGFDVRVGAKDDTDFFGALEAEEEQGYFLSHRAVMRPYPPAEGRFLLRVLLT